MVPRECLNCYHSHDISPTLSQPKVSSASSSAMSQLASPTDSSSLYIPLFVALYLLVSAVVGFIVALWLGCRRRGRKHSCRSITHQTPNPSSVSLPPQVESDIEQGNISWPLWSQSLLTLPPRPIELQDYDPRPLGDDLSVQPRLDKVPKRKAVPSRPADWHDPYCMAKDHSVCLKLYEEGVKERADPNFLKAKLPPLSPDFAPSPPPNPRAEAERTNYVVIVDEQEREPWITTKPGDVLIYSPSPIVSPVPSSDQDLEEGIYGATPPRSASPGTVPPPPPPAPSRSLTAGPLTAALKPDGDCSALPPSTVTAVAVAAETAPPPFQSASSAYSDGSTPRDVSPASSGRAENGVPRPIISRESEPASPTEEQIARAVSALERDDARKASISSAMSL